VDKLASHTVISKVGSAWLNISECMCIMHVICTCLFIILLYCLFTGGYAVTVTKLLEVNRKARKAEVSEASKSLKVGGAPGGVCRRKPQWRSRGQSPRWGVRGQSPPPEAEEVFVFKTLIFNASAIVLHEITHRLSCFFCAHVYVFTNLT